MTHLERQEGYRGELARAQEHLQNLDQQSRQTQVTILQLQGAIAAMNEVIAEEQAPCCDPAERPVLTVVEGGK